MVPAPAVLDITDSGAGVRVAQSLAGVDLD
jgi:hypothetical protein